MALRIPISVCLCEVDVVLEKEVEEVYTQTRRAAQLPCLGDKGPPLGSIFEPSPPSSLEKKRK